jgi:RimJ/RimL family protein N-acetyltransferase/predicted N-acetyltransferase YhbS
VRIEPWGEGDLPLLEKALGDPQMMQHLGGPETAEKIAERQTRYERPGSGQFKIVDETTGEGIGWVGYWERTWRDEQIYEIGWSVLPGFQGRGAASTATAQAIDMARSEGKHRFVHAFPSVENAPSNAICRKLGFTLVEAAEFEYPPGNFMQCNDWRLDLLASRFTYVWRGDFDNAELNALHAEAFDHPVLADDWKGQLRQHSLGWVCARDGEGLVGFVNVAWDGRTHAFILDTMVTARAGRQGVGTRLVEVAVAETRAAGCEWLHVDFDDHLRAFYFDACGFTPTNAGLIAL